MKTSKFYTEERSSVVEKMEAIIDSAKAEGRELTEGETTEFDSLNEKANSLESMAKRSASFEALQASKASKSEEVTEENTPSEIRNYSFQDALAQAASGRLSGLVKEMDQEARNESRYTGQSFKGIGIPASILTRAAVATAAGNATEVMAWTDQLEQNLVLASAGANFYSGISSMKFPVFSSINSGFVAETGGSAPAANGTASSVTLSPKKLISIVNVTAEAITQNASIEAALQRNMAQSVAATLENALLDTSDVSNAPASIFADAAAGSTAAVSAASLLELETTVLGNGVQLEGARMAYLMDMDAYKLAKTLAQVNSVSPLYDNRDKTANGYFTFVSGNVAASGASGKEHVLFGDFSKVHIAQFGGLDVIYDIYTNAGTGEPRYVLTSLVDGDAVQNTTAFASLIEA
jgi:HK97 family phage major capsid protein